jgi:DNA-binding IclR family transcriptional regulator
MARPAPGVERTVALITFLSEQPDRGFRLSELARHLDLSKATAHALVHSLTDVGWLLRDPLAMTYRLGPALVAVGHAASGASHLLDAARAHMRQLRAELGIAVIATVPMDDEFVILAVEGEPRDRTTRPGQRVPPAPPVGAVYLAWSDPEVVDRWLHRLLHRLDDDHDGGRLEHYRTVIAAVRQRGYSVVLGDTRRELEDTLRALAEDGADAKLRAAVEQVLRAIDERGDRLLIDIGESLEPYTVSAMAAPVFDREGRVGLVLALTDLPNPMLGIDVARYGRRLLATTTAVSETTGGLIPAARR